MGKSSQEFGGPVAALFVAAVASGVPVRRALAVTKRFAEEVNAWAITEENLLRAGELIEREMEDARVHEAGQGAATAGRRGAEGRDQGADG